MQQTRSSVRLILTAGALLALGAASPARAQARGHHYRVVDVGTLGGPLSQLNNIDQFLTTPQPFNDAGQLAVTSLTAAGYAAAARWSHGTLSPLASLPNANVGGGGSNASAINAAGVVVGAADDGVINPFNGQPYDHAVRWDRDGIHRLPELDGHASWASVITDDGTILGYANNGIPDANTYAGLGTRAVIWRNGSVQSLGTLGGNSSGAEGANHCRDGAGRLIVIGQAALDDVAGPPFGLSRTDAFVWSDGVMTDLGTLGGGFSVPTAINCSGQVTVIAFDGSNQYYQSFVWSRGTRRLLEPLGAGHFVEANTLDDDGAVVGAVSDASDANFVAAAWDPAGRGRLLGVIGGDSGSVALGVNSRGELVGGSGSVTTSVVPSYAHAFVACRGGAIEDLNTLVPAGAPLALHVAYAINERGEIAGLGTNEAGETHAFILLPDDGGGEPVGRAESGRAIRTAAFRGITEGLRRGGFAARGGRM